MTHRATNTHTKLFRLCTQQRKPCNSGERSDCAVRASAAEVIGKFYIGYSRYYSMLIALVT